MAVFGAPLAHGDDPQRAVLAGLGMQAAMAEINGPLQAQHGVTFELRVGINNILDKDPPLATSEITAGGANNTYEIYDTLGRQLFVSFTAKF